MAGRKGRSGGWNRIPISDHVLRGTHNPTRHGAKPSTLAVAVAPRVDPLPSTVIDGLTGRGLQFVRDAWAMYDGWSPPSLTLLREAGIAIETLERIRGAKGEPAAQRALLAILTSLRLE